MADLIGIGSIIGGAVGGLDSILGGIFSGMNYHSQQEQNDYTKGRLEASEAQLLNTFQVRDKFDGYVDSYLNQLSNGAWYERMNKQDLFAMAQMDREDNAIQRKVTDAENSGVNPFYALGGTGAQASTYTSGTTPQMPAPKFDQIAGLTNLANILSNIDIKQEQAKLLREQTNKTIAETGKINIDALVSGETLNLTKIQGEKLKEDINLIRQQIKVEESKYQKFMEEVAIMQYDLLKSQELDVRYKDTLNAFGYMINKLDGIAGDITADEQSKDALVTIGATLLGASVAGKGVKAGKVVWNYIKKYGDKAKGKAKDLMNFFKSHFKKGDDNNKSNTSDFFG